MENQPFPPFYIEVFLVDGSLTDVADETARWLKPDETRSELFSLPEMDNYKYQPGHTYGYFWAPVSKPTSCAIVANGTIGWNVARRFPRRVISVRVAPLSSEDSICEFVLYEQGEQIRFIRAFRDDNRWDFFTEGAELPFEQNDYYRKRCIRDRFPPLLLKTYCQALGWNIEPKGLFGSHAPAIRLIHHLRSRTRPRAGWVGG